MPFGSELHLYTILLNNIEASYAGTVLWLKIATFELSNKNLPFICTLLRSAQASDCTHILEVQKRFV